MSESPTDGGALEPKRWVGALRAHWPYVITALLAGMLIAFMPSPTPMLPGMAPVQPPSGIMDRLSFPSVRALFLALAAAHILGVLAALIQAIIRPNASSPSPAPLEGDTSWAGLSFKVDGAWLLLLTAVVIVIRHFEGQIINPDFTPFGSDWDAFLVSGRGWMRGDWSLWYPDKWPLYPILSAAMAKLVGGDEAMGGVLVSRWAMTLSVIPLYFAVRLTLGLRAAIATSLLFGTVGLFSLYANATTIYGLYCGMTLLQAGAVAIAFRSQRLWAYLLAGAAVAAGALVDVKIVTTGAVFAVMALWGVIRAARPLWWRGAAMVLAALPAVGAWRYLETFPVKLNALGPKLQINAQEFLLRWARESPHAPTLPPGVPPDPSLVPDLFTRLHYNSWWLRQDLAPDHWWLLAPLVCLGLAAPLLSRGPLGVKRRLLGVEGMLFHLAILSTASGAFALFYMKKYIVHAAPFFLAVLVHGGFLLAQRMVPARAALMRVIIGWGVVFFMGIIAIPMHGAIEPSLALVEPEPGHGGGGRPFWAQGDMLSGMVRDSIHFGQLLQQEGQPLFVCPGREAPPYRFYIDPQPAYLNVRAQVHPDMGARHCRPKLRDRHQKGAVWVVDQWLPEGFLSTFTEDPERFTAMHTFTAERALHPGIIVYIEAADAQGVAEEAPDTGEIRVP